MATFRCLGLAYQAGRAGGSAPAWLSAANEVAVEAFLGGAIRWSQIADVCNAALDRHDLGVPSSVEDVVAADQAARVVARQEIETMSATMTARRSRRTTASATR